MGIFFVIIAPAPTTEFSPISMGPSILAPSATITFSARIGLPIFSHLFKTLLYRRFEPIVTF